MPGQYLAVDPKGRAVMIGRLERCTNIMKSISDQILTISFFNDSYAQTNSWFSISIIEVQQL